MIFTDDLTCNEYKTYKGACRAASNLSKRHPGRVVHVLDESGDIRGRFFHAADLRDVDDVFTAKPVQQKAPRRVRRQREVIDVSSVTPDVTVTAQPSVIVRRNPTNEELIDQCFARCIDRVYS